MEGGVGSIRGGWREVLVPLEGGGGRCWSIRGGWREVLATLEGGGGRCWLH